MKRWEKIFEQTIDINKLEPYTTHVLPLGMKLPIKIVENGRIVGEIQRAVREKFPFVYVNYKKQFYKLYKLKGVARYIINLDEPFDSSVLQKGGSSGRPATKRYGY